MTEIAIHPIYALQTAWFDEPFFDLSQLPFKISAGIYIEDVTSLFAEGDMSWFHQTMSESDVDVFRRVKYAIVRPYENTDQLLRTTNGETGSVEPVEVLMACLRLVRPMRKKLGLIKGRIHEDGTLDFIQFGHPYHVSEVPEIEKLFALRTSDALILRELSAEMLRAMTGDFWKVRMAVQFYQAGFFEQLQLKTRVSLRCSALEAIFSSQKKQGSAVVKQRIKAS